MGGGTAQADDAGRPNLALRQRRAAADAESPLCGGVKAEALSAKPGLGGQSSHAGVGAAPNSDDVQYATNELSAFVRQKSSTCGELILLARHSTAVVGMYSGAQFAKDSALNMLEMFTASIPTASRHRCKCVAKTMLPKPLECMQLAFWKFLCHRMPYAHGQMASVSTARRLQPAST
ncbi:hypothetical protein LEL_05784 [Akanthomyces lecanii RCEF 1005]|uniref:Uncharacterized protein n=1 Tax=Akanthomyces lecanii RCEF 1005 TaxID=1081108 RepID=A0A168G6J1_CORDF|nr:hypothetical protein LEL_05784 [Akanthomyces lecanii RCEF 1005]